MATRFELVCIDAVGTLLRVRGSVGAVYAAAAAAHGIAVDAAAIDTAFHTAMAQAPPALFPGLPPARAAAAERDWWRAVVARAMQPHDRAPGFSAFFDDVFHRFATRAPWELLPGAREALAALRHDGRRLAIVSEMDGRLHAVLADFGLDGFFDVIVLAPREGRTKRDGELFRVALERAGVAAHAAAHVGDSIESDVLASRAAGLAPLHFAAESTDGVPVDAACVRVRAWCEVPAALRMIETRARGAPP